MGACDGLLGKHQNPFSRKPFNIIINILTFTFLIMEFVIII